MCENARTSIRVSRQVAQKQIRNDTKKGIVGNDEGHKEMKKVRVAVIRPDRSCINTGCSIMLQLSIQYAGHY